MNSVRFVRQMPELLSSLQLDSRAYLYRRPRPRTCPPLARILSCVTRAQLRTVNTNKHMNERPMTNERRRRQLNSRLYLARKPTFFLQPLLSHFLIGRSGEKKGFARASKTTTTTEKQLTCVSNSNDVAPTNVVNARSLTHSLNCTNK